MRSARTSCWLVPWMFLLVMSGCGTSNPPVDSSPGQCQVASIQSMTTGCSVLLTCGTSMPGLSCTGDQCTCSVPGHTFTAAGLCSRSWTDIASTFAANCPTSGDAGTNDTPPTDTPPTDTPVMNRCMATTVPCQDQSIMGLGLFSTPSGALISNVSMMGGVSVDQINATGGGMTPTQSFVYARFTATGLEKVTISDEDAYRSLDWDIAFRRFIIRVNSGVSGPSCVDVAHAPAGSAFDDVTMAPAGTVFGVEEYYTADTCMLVPDTSGLGSPASEISDFWRYNSCVQMTNNVYIIRLRDSRLIKLQVLSYYPPDIQTQCNTMMTVPSPSGAGQVRIRWAQLGS